MSAVQCVFLFSYVFLLFYFLDIGNIYENAKGALHKKEHKSLDFVKNNLTLATDLGCHCQQEAETLLEPEGSPGS